MVKWQRGKDKNNDEFKKVVKAYKYVHQDNKCLPLKKTVINLVKEIEIS